MSSKRTLDNFFTPSPTSIKKRRLFVPNADELVTSSASHGPPSSHPSYPFAVSQLPASLLAQFDYLPSADPRHIADQPDLDLLYYQPFLPRGLATTYFDHLRQSLFFYRVTYPIKRGPVETIIRTPRYTTVFGLDDTAVFSSADDSGSILDARTKQPVPSTAYKCRPRPLPDCLDALRRATEMTTGRQWNFCLINYYASGADSISYHSDDERFLGPDPAIASFSLGAKRDFLLKHKPSTAEVTSLSLEREKGAEKIAKDKPLKLSLASGDMVLMQGATQANWMHSIPKRAGKDADKGRINITFRRALVRGGTENYYRYNVGDGGVYRWDKASHEMTPWDAKAKQCEGVEVG